MDSSAREQQLHICIGERKVAIVIKVVTKSEVRETWQGKFKDRLGNAENLNQNIGNGKERGVY